MNIRSDAECRGGWNHSEKSREHHHENRTDLGHGALGNGIDQATADSLALFVKTAEPGRQD